MILPARSSGARTSLSSGTASTHFAGLRLARLYSSSHTSTTSPALPFSTIQSWPVSPQSTIPSTTYRLISCARKSTAAILSSSKRGKTLRSAIEMRYPALPNRSTVAPCRLPLGSPMRSDEGGSLSVIGNAERRIQNAECRIKGRRQDRGLSFCILHSAFCISSRFLLLRLPVLPLCRAAEAGVQLVALLGLDGVLEEALGLVQRGVGLDDPRFPQVTEHLVVDRDG